MTKLPIQLIDSQEKKRTDILVQLLLNFEQQDMIVHSSNAQLDLKTANEQTLTSEIERLKLIPKKTQDDPQHLKKLIRSRLYNCAEGLEVRSWTMLEHVYRREPCPFPTRARGLFTLKDSKQALGHGRYKILARGYDKFFNVGEVSWTQWDTLRLHSKGPYHLTMKTNGCIIFISALTPSQLLVTSKHAMDTELDEKENANDGGSTDKPVSHARMGERWLERHLDSVGLTKANLARELWDANATAVAELTDDTFEEHVLPTPEEETGLNLHGINLNQTVLHTYPPDHVAQCARRWGLHLTPWKTVENIEDVKRECLSIEQNGWPGRDGFIEGVVVRGFLPQDEITDPDKARQAIFWKVKFQEPYLMYREWRELTKRMLGELAKVDQTQLSKFILTQAEPGKLTSYDTDGCIKLFKININKIQNPESKLYVHWTAAELLQDPGRFSDWKLNQGIVSTRERFLAWRCTPDAQLFIKTVVHVSQKAKSQLGLTLENNRTFDKTILVPIAIPGCGKTSLGIALGSFLKCSHTQSDDIKAKKTGPMFIANLKKLLLDSSGPHLIFADKNNHLRTHRQAIADLVKELRQGVKVKDPMKSKKDWGSASKAVTEKKRIETRVIALAWDVPAHPYNELHRLASERIMKRGANHQSLRPELTSGGVEVHHVVLSKFLRDFEEFEPEVNTEDECFDKVIELSCHAPLINNLRVLVKRLHEIMPDQCPLPTDKEFTEALSKLGKYRVSVRKDMKLDPKLCEPRYFGIRIPVDLKSLVLELFSQKSETQLEPDRALFNEFLIRKRFTTVPHITLLHSSELSNASGTGSEMGLKDLWSHYRAQAVSNHLNKYEVEVTIGPKIVWNDRVMAIEVSGLGPEERVRWNDRPRTLHDHQPHISVGTLSNEIRPIEAGLLLDKVLVNLAANGYPGEGNHVFEFPTRIIRGSIRGLN
ncbi:hypothetical protein CROQUDRAFT_47484 [Cronartium quercuum f. sp. fusiforme G11]|uniref:RNA ligase (ATP) n=1 Tax=Cronartium quercuum f. sp. fusiforme G11 TaxID=708437 RepID=A0A9P6NE71_9BASI|nr:hypothetical protein CROQUDRAFT_47484 [Cronartium quercuum f. sp. fusiforme G11]